MPYLARYEIHQVIGLTDETTSQDSNFFALATSVPVRRIEFRIGKMTLPDFLRLQRHRLRQPPAVHELDRGQQRRLGLCRRHARLHRRRHGRVRRPLLVRCATASFAMPVVANGIDLDWAFSRAHGQNWRVRSAPQPCIRSARARRAFCSTPTAPTWASIAKPSMRILTERIQRPPSPRTSTSAPLKYGFGYNTQQELTDNLRVFGRFGWNEGQHESFAYTEVDQTVEIGRRLRRPARGTAPRTRSAWPSSPMPSSATIRTIFGYGGLGFLLGDGKLNYGRENIVESYYNWHAWRGMFYCHRRAAHLQSRVQPRPRTRLGGLRARPRRFLDNRFCRAKNQTAAGPLS